MDYSLSSIAWRIGAVLALVFANGFFVAAEFSIVTVRKTRIDQLLAEGHHGARAVRRATSVIFTVIFFPFFTTSVTSIVKPPEFCSP